MDEMNQEVEATETQQSAEPSAEQVQQAPQSAKKQSTTESNMATLRELKDRAERERDELLRRLKEVEVKTQPQQQQKVLRDDDIPEWGDVNKELTQLREEIKRSKEQSALYTTEARLKSQYPDFDSVVSKDNIQLLKDLHPEIAETLNANPDWYSKGASAYKILKQMGIAKEDTFVQDKELAQKNAAKPRPLTSVSPQQGNSPLDKANAFANGLTQELKDQLWKEMQETSKQSY